MSNVIVDKQKIDILANAIANKSGVPVTMTLDEMKEAVDGIDTSGIVPTGNINITHSGQTDVTNYATATVPSVDSYLVVAGYGSYKTVSGNRKWEYYTYADSDGISGWHDGTVPKDYTKTYNAVPANTTVTPSTSAQTIGGANYMMEGAVTVAAMPSGTAGTPTATKGTVSNHSVTVTPSVTNSAGYITGGTKTGTGVSVSASELVSGSQTITQNGTVDVTNLASVTVAVEGGGGSGMTVATANTTLASANASISFTGLSGEPTSFVITTASDLATGASPYKTATVVFDGTDLHGQIVTNTSNANASYSTSFTKSYSNGTLTITGTGTNFQANQYKLIYTHGGNSANIGTAETQVGSGATSITFTGLTDEPDYFSVIFKSDFGTSSGYQRVQSVAYDGTNTYGVAMDSGANAMSAWSYTYSNGSLTVSSQGTNNGGYFHQPGYYQLTYGIGGTVEPTEIEVEPLSVMQNGTYTAPTGKAYSPVTVNVSGGSVNVATTTWTNSDSTAVTHTFTGLSGTPKAAFLRCTSSLSRSSSSSNYYVADMRWTGSATAGNSFRRSNGTYANVTSGYSFTASGTSLTVTTSGTSTSNPGSFYNGTYELVYVY